MNLYLERGLSNHRHGRFFASQLDAQAVDDFPKEGGLLLHGKTFQEFTTKQQKDWWKWSNRSGCVVLLIPPYNNGVVYQKVDWKIALNDETMISDDGVLAKSVAEEVNQHIEGTDGEFDRSFGHQWRDYTINTRYFKQHSGCGVFAATCLPLWSISLLEHDTETKIWLEALLELAGQPNEVEELLISDQDVELQPTDYTLMVCIYALGINSVEDLNSALSQTMINTFTIAEQDINEGVERLTSSGYFGESGLTDAGLAALEQSPYWGYTERLKEEFQS